MGLTSGWFAVLLVAAAVAGALALWPRVRGPRPVRLFAAGAALAPDDPSRGVRSPVWPARTVHPRAQLPVASSRQDPESPPRFADAVAAAAAPPAQVSTLRLSSGGHNWNTWGRMFPDAFTWVSARLEAPRAVPPDPSAAP
jgi:hypothetical protein